MEDRTYAALEELGIPFDRVDHDPAEDMADCAVISQALGADICKNLLLTPRNRSAFLPAGHAGGQALCDQGAV